MADRHARQSLERIFRAGVEACMPERVLGGRLPPPQRGRTMVIACGKAAAAMARVAEGYYPARLEGLAVVPHDQPGSLARLELLRAGHPVPDEDSIVAARKMMALAEGAGPDDHLVVLLSGGASALACLPGPGLSLASKQEVTCALLRSGAPIGGINCVRRHLSAIKGGRLALAARPAPVTTLAISDVADDRPEDIGSGPTVADPTTLREARLVLERYGIADPGRGWSESVKSGNFAFEVVASPQDAIAAAAAEAARFGYRPVQLGIVEGEAREVGRDHARLALEAAPGTALISGGELGVTVRGSGSGGRNREYALAAAIELQGRADVTGLAADSDGKDGLGEEAGAFFDGTTIFRSRRDPIEALETNDSGGFFDAIGDGFLTGPTGTNVSDLRIMLVGP